MLAAHAERLAELPGPVAVLLAEPPDPLLPARSRAELAAGLRGVSVVVMPHEDGQPVTIEGGHVVDEREAHLKLRQELIERVHQRHQ